MLKTCKHENLVQFREAYLNGNELWMVMEFMPLGKLTDLIAAKHSLPEHVISLVCREVLKALSCIHNLHLVHRAVKSDNVLLGAHGEVKLGEFFRDLNVAD